jgi:hypothetical protein
MVLKTVEGKTCIRAWKSSDGKRNGILYKPATRLVEKKVCGQIGLIPHEDHRERTEDKDESPPGNSPRSREINFACCLNSISARADRSRQIRE